MVTPELQKFVQESLVKGQTPEQIKITLRKGGGWTEKDLDEVFIENIGKYKKLAKHLVTGSISGMIASVLYGVSLIYFTNCGHLLRLFDSGSDCSVLRFNILVFQSSYYFVGASLFLISGILLKKFKKVGSYFFYSALCVIGISFFVKFTTIIPMNYSGQTTSLFMNSINATIVGSFFFVGVPAVLVIVYFTTILINLFHFKKWLQVLK